MMIDKATASTWVREAAASGWDAALADRGGFARTATSLVYARKVADGGRQRIHLDLRVRPPYAPTEFHLHPRCSVAFPAMATACAELFGPHARGFEKNAPVDVKVLEQINPQSSMFLFDSADRLAGLAPEIERCLVEDLVPYLDERTSIAALTEVNEREWAASGAEPGDVGRLPILVAAGRLAGGDAERARRTLDAAYPAGTPGHALYEAAFTAVGAA